MLRHRFRRVVAPTAAAFLGLGLLVGTAGSAQAAPSPAAASAAVLMQSFDSSNGRIGGGWWEGATALSAILTYEQATGDKQYEYAMTQAYAKNSGFTNEYIDDTGWWALAWMQAYDVTGNTNYLNIAKTNVNYMHTYWDTKCGGGGVYWNSDRKYKATISNELFLAASAGLHNRIPGDSQYLGWANDTWNWLKGGSGLITGSNQVQDGVTVSGCSHNTVELTYNQGTILYALVELNRATGNSGLLTTAKNIASATIANKARNGVLVEGCEPGCTHDVSGMKGIFMRYLRVLATAANTTQYDGFITSTANSILAFDTNGAGQQGVSYTGPFSNWSYLTQTSALEALVAAGNQVTVPLPTGSGALRGAESARCVDVPGGNQANGTAPALWDCSNGANQTWTSTSSKQLTIFGGKCLDVVGHGTGDGAKVDIWDCNSGLNQQWTLNADGSVVGVESGKCLDVTGHATANASPLEIWSCNGGANQKWSRTSGSTPPAAVTATIKGQESGRCVDVLNGNTANGARPGLWDCTGGDNQKWTATASGQLTALGKCLDVFGGGTADGSTVEIWDCTGGNNQQWTLRSDGTIVGVGSGKCLDVTSHGTANGTLLEIWTCNGGANQNWART